MESSVELAHGRCAMGLNRLQAELEHVRPSSCSCALRRSAARPTSPGRSAAQSGVALRQVGFEQRLRHLAREKGLVGRESTPPPRSGSAGHPTSSRKPRAPASSTRAPGSRVVHGEDQNLRHAGNGLGSARVASIPFITGSGSRARHVRTGRERLVDRLTCRPPPRRPRSNPPAFPGSSSPGPDDVMVVGNQDTGHEKDVLPTLHHRDAGTQNPAHTGRRPQEACAEV